MAPLEITPEDLERARVVNMALPGCANRDERVTVIAAALAAARAEGERKWQPIETAPRDGTEVILFGACRPKNSSARYAKDANVGWWDGGNWQTRVGGEVCDASHWMPLPEPPALIPQEPGNE